MSSRYASSQSSSRFLELPRELRDLIFEEYVWTRHEEKALPQHLDGHSPPLLRNLTATSTQPSQLLGLLLANRQVHNELKEVLFRTVYDRSTQSVAIEAPSQELYWSFASLPYNRCFAVHLRRFTLELRSDEQIADRKWEETFHDRLEESIEAIIDCLPSLEHLSVVFSWEPHVKWVSPKKWTRPTNPSFSSSRLLYYLPKRHGHGQKNACADASQTVSGPPSRLKTLTMSMVVRFMCAKEFPLSINTRKNSFDPQTGELEYSFMDFCSTGFVNEWAMAELKEMMDLVDVVMGDGFWKSTFQNVPKHALVEQLATIWRTHGKLTRARCKALRNKRSKERLDRLAAQEAALKVEAGVVMLDGNSPSQTSLT